ncbi:MAG: lysylphosphatidylglycerol synthase transmembrane domain-containing protein [Bellilinea sp.]
MRQTHERSEEEERASKLPNDPGIVSRARPGSVKFRLAWLFWLLVIPALWWALREISLQQLVDTLASLRGWQLLALAAVNVGVLAIFSLRWWFILRVMGGRIPFFRAVGYHLIGFGVSYFTVGPQVGGEPLQVLLVSRHQPVNLPAAVSSVFLDKVFELLTNFTFLMVGSLLILAGGAAGNWPGGYWWVITSALLVLPLLHLVALSRGKFPITALMTHSTLPVWLQRAAKLIAQSEEQISTLLRTRPAVVLTVTAISAGGWLAMFAEYALMLRFLGQSINLVQLMTAFLASQLAFLTPMPGGLGALEAGQVLAFSSFGAAAAVGLSASLVMRVRDFVFGLLGLFLAGNELRRLNTHEEPSAGTESAINSFEKNIIGLEE